MNSGYGLAVKRNTHRNRNNNRNLENNHNIKICILLSRKHKKKALFQPSRQPGLSLTWVLFTFLCPPRPQSCCWHQLMQTGVEPLLP